MWLWKGVKYLFNAIVAILSFSEFERDRNKWKIYVNPRSTFNLHLQLFPLNIICVQETYSDVMMRWRVKWCIKGIFFLLSKTLNFQIKNKKYVFFPFFFLIIYLFFISLFSFIAVFCILYYLFVSFYYLYFI